MTPAAFRKLALGLPEAYEGSHLGHADFRVGKRVFATLGYPDDSCGMVKLTPAQQAQAMRSAPRTFTPIKGKWGEGGATQVRLSGATAKHLRQALQNAWDNVASKSLLAHTRPPLSAAINSGYRRYLSIALKLPGTAESTSYGTPAVKVLGKLLSRWRTEEEGALAIRCDFLDRQILLQANPRVFFVTDHYLNYPMVLVRLEKISARSLKDLTQRAWRLVAPKKLSAEVPGD